MVSQVVGTYIDVSSLNIMVCNSICSMTTIASMVDYALVIYHDYYPWHMMCKVEISCMNKYVTSS